MDTTTAAAEVLSVRTAEARSLTGREVMQPGRTGAARAPAGEVSSPLLGLEDWFAPHGLPGFVDTVLGRRPLYVGPRPRLAARLADTFALHSVEDVLALRDADMYAWFPTLDGGTASAPIPNRTARLFHAGGTTLYVRNIARFAAHEREMAAAFDVPRANVHCQLYCNRPGAVTTMHFDPSDVITVQLTGRKTWRIAPNRFAAYPLDGWAPGKPISPGLRAYTHDVPPAEMPADATGYELEPGAILHVPRGHWHQTVSDEDSLSVHFIIPTTTRLHAMLAILRNELMRHEWWRRPAGDGHSAEQLAADYAELRRLLDRIDPRDVVHAPVPAAPIGPETPFIRCGQAAFGVDGVDAGRGTARVTITAYGYRDTKTTALEIGMDLLAACRLINDLPPGTALRPPDVLNGLSQPDARHLLALLEQAHLIRRQDPATTG